MPEKKLPPIYRNLTQIFSFILSLGFRHTSQWLSGNHNDVAEHAGWLIGLSPSWAFCLNSFGHF